MTTPIHGNYHRYYAKRPPSTTDARLALLPPSLFTDKHVLDIGCNEGWVTCDIAQKWNPRKVTGVDIDDTLIQAAWRRRRTVWSLQSPSGPAHFPASFEHELGPLPIPPSEGGGFPHNVVFRTADWVQGIEEDKEGYDVVLALSITKWIHLHNGDDGLITFFRRIFTVLHPGGTLVLEPQPWDSYAKARRMSETLKERYKSLTLRPEEFPRVLEDIGFKHLEHYDNIGEGGFCRPVDVYMKPK